MIYDIRETGVGVYRQYDAAGRVAGYTLFPSRPGVERIGAIDPERDRVPQIQVHVFGTRDEADAFREGLILAGEREHDCERIPEGWAVLRPVPYASADEDDPTIKVITYNAPPRVLITVARSPYGCVSSGCKSRPGSCLFTQVVITDSWEGDRTWESSVVKVPRASRKQRWPYQWGEQLYRP